MDAMLRRIVAPLCLAATMVVAGPDARSQDADPRLAEYYGFQPLEIYKLDDRISGVLAADLDGDGQDDLLWRSDLRDGAYQYQYWKMVNGEKRAEADLSTPVSRDWTVVGIGQVDGEADEDIVFVSLSGQVHYWAIDGGTRMAGTDIEAIDPTAWEVVGVGDIRGTGQASIVFRHRSTGTPHAWHMDGNRVGSRDNLGGTHTAADYGIVGVNDLDGNGVADLIFRDLQRREVMMYWSMGSGATVTGVVPMDVSQAAGWVLSAGTGNLARF